MGEGWAGRGLESPKIPLSIVVVSDSSYCRGGSVIQLILHHGGSVMMAHIDFACAGEAGSGSIASCVASMWRLGVGVRVTHMMVLLFRVCGYGGHFEPLNFLSWRKEDGKGP